MKYIILSLCLFLYVVSAAQYSIPNGWEEAEEEQYDLIDPDKSQDLFRYIRDSSVVTGMMVIHKGKVLFSYGDLTENSYIASCRKSVLSILYGKYVLDGTIDLNKTISDLKITDVEGILPIENKATVQDIISARSGVYHPEGYPGGMQQYAPPRGSKEPGTHWLYSNWDFNVAGYIFEKETGKNIYDEVEKQLAIPLGMEDWYRELQNKQGDTTISKYLAYPMWFSTRDMARIGLLMLNRGKWGDQTLIEEAWIDEMIKQRTSNKELNESVPVYRDKGVNFGYGYMWWLWEDMNDWRYEGGYSAKGAMGQNISVFPALDMVVVFKTKAAYRRRNSSQTRINLVKKSVELFTDAAKK